MYCGSLLNTRNEKDIWSGACLLPVSPPRDGMCTPDFLPGRMQTVANGLLQLLFLALKWTNQIIISPTNTRCKDKLTASQLRHCMAHIDRLTKGKVKTPNVTGVTLAFTDYKWKTCQKCFDPAGIGLLGSEEKGKTESNRRAVVSSLCAFPLSLQRDLIRQHEKKHLCEVFFSI